MKNHKIGILSRKRREWERRAEREEKSKWKKILKCLIINLDTSFSLWGEWKMRCFLLQTSADDANMGKMSHCLSCVRMCFVIVVFLSTLLITIFVKEKKVLRWSRRMKNKKIIFHSFMWKDKMRKTRAGMERSSASDRQPSAVLRHKNLFVFEGI